MPWHPHRGNRKRAVGLTAAIHIVLGAVLILGLGARGAREAKESLAVFDVAPPPMPLSEPEPPAPAEQAAKEEAGAADLRARPAPTLAPRPAVRLPVKAPLARASETAPIPGRDANAGAGLVAGEGRGAGGSGDGTGGGGQGGSGGGGGGGGPAEEARLLSGNLTRSDYRRIRMLGSTRGEATLAIEVSAEGRLTRCLALRGSGNPALDAELCALLTRTRWSPARNSAGAPVTVALRYVATWQRD